MVLFAGGFACKSAGSHRGTSNGCASPPPPPRPPPPLHQPAVCDLFSDGCQIKFLRRCYVIIRDNCLWVYAEFTNACEKQPNTLVIYVLRQQDMITALGCLRSVITSHKQKVILKAKQEQCPTVHFPLFFERFSIKS